jgi:apolipoprotein D and lipocalin family protein
LRIRDALVLDPDYRWALVAGYSHDYLWILVRERQLPPAVLEDLLAKARKVGFCHGWVDLSWWRGALTARQRAAQAFE